MTDSELLREYATGTDQGAFAELIGRHGDWVYCCAKRLVRQGDLAEDVAQGVFILLAQKAGRLDRKAHLAGWLFRATQYCAQEAMRAKARRQKHEREAAMQQQIAAGDEATDWDEIWPVLDGAVQKLRACDREAVLLRFYERRSLAAVGQAMGVSEKAAAKRVERAVGKLRGVLASKGVTAGAAGLGVVLTEKVTEAAPVGVATAAGGAGGTGSAGVIAKGAMKVMAWAKVKVAAGVLVIVGLIAGSGLVIAQMASPAKAGGEVRVSPASQPVGAKLVLVRPTEAGIIHARTTPALDQDAPVAGLRTTDAWFVRGKGAAFVEQYANGTTYVHLDDGVNTWRYRTGGQVIGRSETEKTFERKLGRFDEELARVSDIETVREPAHDRVIAGLPCRCYRLKPKSDLGITELWVDQANKVRGFTSSLSEESQVAIRYDEEPPSSLFSTVWPKDAEVINADTYLAEKFPVETALFTKEAAGLVFAVHECQVDERGCYYVICSTRPAKGVDKELGKTSGYMGNVSISGTVQGNGKLEPLGYVPHEIADLQNVYGWVQVRWFVMVPDPATPELHGVPSFAGTLSAANELETWRKGKGLAVSEQFTVELDGEKATNTTAADFARGVWIEGEHMWPAIDGTLSVVVPGKNGHGVQKPYRPGQVPQAEYVRNVQQRIDDALNPQNASRGR